MKRTIHRATGYLGPLPDFRKLTHARAGSRVGPQPHEQASNTNTAGRPLPVRLAGQPLCKPEVNPENRGKSCKHKPVKVSLAHYESDNNTSREVYSLLTPKLCLLMHRKTFKYIYIYINGVCTFFFDRDYVVFIGSHSL